MRPRSLYLVDDHPVVGLGLRLALRSSRAFLFSGSSIDPVAAIACISDRRPDVAVLDLIFEGMVRLDLVTSVRRSAPASTIVCFTSLPARQWSQEAYEAGADLFVEKSVELGALLDLIASHAPPAPAASVGAKSKAWALPIEGVDLTRREVSVAARLAAGVSVSDIATEMSISVNTVAVHQENIRRKVGCSTAKQLVARLAALRFAGNGSA